MPTRALATLREKKEKVGIFAPFLKNQIWRHITIFCKGRESVSYIAELKHWLSHKNSNIHLQYVLCFSLCPRVVEDSLYNFQNIKENPKNYIENFHIFYENKNTMTSICQKMYREHGDPENEEGEIICTVFDLPSLFFGTFSDIFFKENSRKITFLKKTKVAEN